MRIIKSKLPSKANYNLTVSLNRHDGPEDWYIYRKCSQHVTEVYQRYGVWSHVEALATRDFMRKLLGMRKYSLSDLTAYICLMPTKTLQAARIYYSTTHLITDGYDNDYDDAYDNDSVYDYDYAHVYDYDYDYLR